MSDAASNYLENELLDHALGTGAFPMPTGVSLALFTDAGSTAAHLEASDIQDEVSTAGTGYARKAITFTAAANGQSKNSADVVFDVAQADWGTITHIAIIDGVDNVLFWGAVTTPKLIETNDIFQVSANNLTLSLS